MPDDARVVVLGRAATQGQLLPLGSDDPVIAARAIRRALSAAGRHATEVTELVLASPEAIDPGALTRLARRALGSHGATIAPRSVVSQATDAAALADQAVSALASAWREVGIGLAVGIDHRGDVVALCLGRDTMARGAGPPPREG